ncbi:Epoxide hydrolase [Mycena venus]|uniref:Epoxide hydrolase n=1 Tax=Mycena venus TaxID=2733690 RepID=A0A8H6X1S5_9AGAR|nr:Epoxide hydrolase [Mycena venus]
MDNSAAVYNILCNEEAWHWDTDDGHKLVFHHDGTGEITSWAELCIFIVAIFEWKVHDPAAIQYTESSPPAPRSFVRQTLGLLSPPTPPLLRVSIDFTLTKRRPLLYGRPVDPQRRLNEDLLLDAAFEPRVLNITVERGRFPAPRDYGARIPITTWYQSRLSFDVSPYPAREAWQPDSHNMVDSVGQPKMRQFSGRALHILPSTPSLPSLWERVGKRGQTMTTAAESALFWRGSFVTAYSPTTLRCPRLGSAPGSRGLAYILPSPTTGHSATSSPGLVEDPGTFPSVIAFATVRPRLGGAALIIAVAFHSRH